MHLLNAPTATVLSLIEQQLTAEEIILRLEEDAPKGTGEELLRLAIDELASARLVETQSREVVSPSMLASTRRQMVQRLAGVSAAILIPAVLTVLPNKAYAQAGTSLANGAPCAHSNQCLSGCCGGTSSGGCNNNHCDLPANCPGKCTV
jgi:hypothetical protein